MNKKDKFAIQKIRENRGFSRQELAERSGVNFRTLQDYEQGHKNISSAKAETVYRLSVALGCDMEDLILDIYHTDDNRIQKKQSERFWAYHSKIQRMMEEDLLNSLHIYSSKHKVYGKIELVEWEQQLMFFYRGKMHSLLFDAKVSEQSMPWLEDVAVLMMDAYIDNLQFEEIASKKEAGINNEM